MVYWQWRYGGNHIIGENIELRGQRWKHPGGKLREQGAEALSESELLAILVSTGIPGKSAKQIAEEVLRKYGSLRGLAGRPLEELLEFRGLSDVKIIRIAAAMEIARRFGKD